MHPANALKILKLSEAAFVARYQSTPLARPGWEGLRRNAAIVLGNSGDSGLIPELEASLDDASPQVREALEWAINQLGKMDAVKMDAVDQGN